MPETHDLYLRAHTVVPENKQKTKTTRLRRPKPKPWPSRILCYDCESLTDPTEKLTFGAYRICTLEHHHYRCEEEGLFYADDLRTTQRRLLEAYVKREHPDIEAESFTPKLKLILRSRSDFVEKVFFKAILDNAMIVGFNLPFDLARIAVDWGISDDGGWSLTLSHWVNTKTKVTKEHPYRPRVIYNALNSKTALIKSTRARRSSKKSTDGNCKLWPTGRFLDVRTLLWALHNVSYSLKSACKEFHTTPKIEHNPTGKVTHEEIAYCLRDVKCTVEVLNVAKAEYDLHPIGKGPDELYSLASMAKGYLEQMQIASPRSKVADQNYAFGIAMQGYIGGRAECRIRKCEVPVVPVDFMSQYATVNELLGNWSILIADSISFVEATKEVRQLLRRVSLDRCYERKLWRSFAFFALVRPDDDILPVRTVYNGVTQNIGINHLTSDEPIWLAGPDIIAAVILSGGKVPRIEKAYRVAAHGKQSGLGTTNLRGMVEIDASKTSFFKHVIEQRAANEHDESLHYFLKILASSGSYGLFVELNPTQNAKHSRIKVFSGEDSFTDQPPVIEKPGQWFCPSLGSLITAGGRLLLAVLETSVRKAGGTYLFCDTDSLCIVASKHGGALKIPGVDGERTLTWTEVDEIAKRFDQLNPYNKNIVKDSILKVHKLNRNKGGERRQLYGYGIAAKRYAIYEKKRNDIEIVDPKAHALGYFHPPMDSPEGWEKEHDMPKWIFDTWDYIMRGVLKLKRRRPAWFDFPVMMKLTLSTPHHALQNMAKCDLTRPHNFMMMPKIAPFGYPPGVNPADPHLTLITSYSSKREDWIKSKCINIHDSNSPIYGLSFEYIDDGVTASPMNFYQLVESYQNHPEAKSLGPDGKHCDFDTQGLLQRAHIIAGERIFIGKESDRHWEHSEDLSLLEFRAIEYRRRQKVAATAEQLRRIGLVTKREFIRRGVNQHTLEKICGKDAVRPVVLAKVLRVLDRWESEQRSNPQPGGTHTPTAS